MGGSGAPLAIPVISDYWRRALQFIVIVGSNDLVEVKSAQPFGTLLQNWKQLFFSPLLSRSSRKAKKLGRLKNLQFISEQVMLIFL